MHRSRWALAAFLLVVTSRASAGQITTFVPVPKPKVDTSQAVAQKADSAKRDSVARVTLTNMKAWVDSAVGLPPVNRSPVTDTAAAINQALPREDPFPPEPVASLPPDTTRPRRRGRTSSFANGAVAPETATHLPALLIGGLVLIAGGALLIHDRSPEAREDS